MTKIEWTNRTWNPVVGCTKISEGCKNCYAEKFAYRLACMEWKDDTRKLKYCNVTDPDTKKWNGKTYLAEEELATPFSWRKPSMVFVCSMGDIFHESVPFEWIDKVMAVIALSPKHTYQVLTKRPERMLEYFSRSKDEIIAKWEDAVYDIGLCDKNEDPDAPACYLFNRTNNEWPLKNLWLGVTAENQEQAENRIPYLLQIPAAVKFISAEPLLGYIDFECWEISGCPTGFLEEINWIIAGPETGSGARPMEKEWLEDIYDQCKDYGIPFFDKKNILGLNLQQFPANSQQPKAKGQMPTSKTQHP
jgi:protein gp37